MPRTLLVVDDSATMRKVFELTFAGEDVTVITHDGAEGVAARAREVRPHAAIVDVSLATGNGYDVVRALRSDGGMANVPIYLLYSDHSPLDESSARACGAAGALAKPFDTQAMIDRVRQAFSITAAAPPQPPAPQPKPLPTETITIGTPPPRPAPPPPRPPVPVPTGPRGPVIPNRPGASPHLGTSTAGSPLSLDELSAKPAMQKPTPGPMALPTRGGPHAPEPSSPDLGRHIAHEVHNRVTGLGLTQAQVEAVTALTKDVVERVVWEVVPQLAEVMIREEIKRLTAE